MSLLFAEEHVTAVVFEEIASKIKIIGTDTQPLSTSIGSVPYDELLTALDKAISTAEESLPENRETQKTIFGVPNAWVEDGHIKKSYLALLKKACEELGLTPIGFLITIEAVAHLLQKEEGAPASALLTEIGKQKLSITVIRAGKIIETHAIPIEKSIAESTDSLLRQFTKSEILPARIILLLRHGTHDAIIQSLISHSWSKSLPFLHVPQISTLPADFDIQAVLSGAATQLGFEIIDKPIRRRIEKAPAVSLDTTHTFGFVREKDLAKENEDEKTAPEPSSAKADDSEAVNPQLDTEKEQEIHEETQSQDSLLEDRTAISSVAPEVYSSPIHHSTQSVAVHAIMRMLLSFTSRIRFPTLNANVRFPSGNRKLLALAVLIFLGMVTAGILYITQLRATVVLEITPKIIEQEKDILFAIDKENDFGKGVVGAETTTISEQGSLETSVTGKKEIGEKAKGSITIYNNSSETKTFQKGTLITSSNGLDFVLDESSTVASASGTASASRPGSSKADIIAKEIGKEYNLPSGTQFTVNSLSALVVEGKNETAFTGGSKKEVIVVAKADQDKITAELAKKLEKSAQTTLQEKTSKDTAILPLFVDTAFENKEFDKKIGDEAKSVTLKATISYQAVEYRKKDAEEFSRIVLRNQFNTMKLSKKGITYAIDNLKKNINNDVSGKIHMKASLIPHIDEKKLKESLSGKSFDEARNIALQTAEISNIRIAFTPSLPVLPKILPKLPQNISIVIKTP